MTAYKAPCPEGKYDAHVDVLPCPGHFADWPPGEQMSCTVRHELRCPGGTVLDPEQTIIIEKVDGEWKLPFELGNSVTIFGPEGAPLNVQEMFDALAAAKPRRET